MGDLSVHGGRRDRVVAGVGRIDVAARVDAVGVQIGIDLLDVGLSGGLDEVLGVVEDQEIARPGQSGADPLDVVGTAELLGAGAGRDPADRRRGALAVAGRIAETIEEIARRGGRQGDAGRRIAGDDRVL